MDKAPHCRGFFFEICLCFSPGYWLQLHIHTGMLCYYPAASGVHHSLAANIPAPNIKTPQCMLEKLKSILTTNHKANVPQMALMLLLFLVFISNVVGLLQFRDNFIPDISFSLDYFRDPAGNLVFPRVTESGEFIYLLLSGVVLALLLPVLSPIAASILAFMLAVPPFAVALYSPTSYIELPMQFNLLVILTLFGINVLIKYFAETREKQKLLDVFSQFVPPEIVNTLNYESKQEALLGEARFLTVFFCDLRNFTSMSEQLDPREVVKLLNEYFNTMTSILYRYGATIDKYVAIP